MNEPKLRFKREDGSSYPEIKAIPFGQIIEPFSERTKTENEDTLLSCAIDGVFLNSELFGHQRGASNKGYKKVRKNTLILSAQNLHLGNANVNRRFEHGIISPAYNTYNIIGCDPDYLAQWVKREATNKFFYNATTTGASQCRRNVDWNKLYEQELFLPCEEEQKKIAAFLDQLDEIIQLSEVEIEKLEQKKRIVMRKIFSREIRFFDKDGQPFPDWESITFEELFEPLNNNTFSRDKLCDNEGTVMNIHYGDILTKYDSICDVSTCSVPYIKGGDNISQKYSKLRDGDIVLADTAEDATVGKAIELHGIKDNVVLSGLHTIACRPRITVEPKYLGYYINSPNYHDQLKPFMQGIKVTSIGRKNIAKTIIQIPSSKVEQSKIAELMVYLDQAINAAKDELLKYSYLKKGLLQQMFS